MLVLSLLQTYSDRQEEEQDLGILINKNTTTTSPPKLKANFARQNTERDKHKTNVTQRIAHIQTIKPDKELYFLMSFS